MQKYLLFNLFILMTFSSFPSYGNKLNGFLGTVMGGGGEYETDGSHAKQMNGGKSSRDFDDETGLLLRLDYYLEESNDISYGLLLQFTPGYKVDVKGSDSNYKVGKILRLGGFIEKEVFKKKKSTIRLKGLGSLNILFPHKDLEDSIEELNNAKHDANDGPYFGFALGGGGSYIYQVDNDLSIKVELILDYINQEVVYYELNGTGKENSFTVSGLRFLLMFGAGFNL